MFQISEGDKIFWKDFDIRYGFYDTYKCYDVKSLRNIPDDIVIVLQGKQTVYNEETGQNEHVETDPIEITLSRLKCRLGIDMFLCNSPYEQSPFFYQKDNGKVAFKSKGCD